MRRASPGLIKLALAIHHRAIPPSLHFKTPNPDIPFEALHLRVATELQPWPGDEPAVGGVSSFGWGGTNCHMILEELPESRAQILLLEAPHRLAVSGRSPREVAELLDAFSRRADSAASGCWAGGRAEGLGFLSPGHRPG